MVVRQVTFVCDVCGARLSFDEIDIPTEKKEDLSDILPETWRKMTPYGDVCNKCCNELDGVYERIHAPMKAKEQHYPYEDKEKTRKTSSRNWENFLQ